MPGVSTKHSIWGIGVGAGVLGAITDVRASTGSNVRGEPTSGEPWNRFVSLVAQNPMFNFTTLDIGSALDFFGTIATAISGLSGGLSVFGQKHTEGGTRAGSTSHRKINATEGIVVPRSLSCDHQGDARLTFEALVTYDGTNNPFVFTDSVSLPAGLTDALRYTLGPVTIGSVTLGQIKSLEIDFGVRAETEGADGEIWDRFSSVRAVQPMITLRGIDISWFSASNVPLIGKAATQANTTIYLRKRSAGGTFVADGTAEHIKFNAAGMIVIEDALSGSGQDAAGLTARMTVNYDGTNNPIVVDTTSTIA